MRVYCFLLLFLLLTNVTYGQNHRSVTGRVLDPQDQPVYGALIGSPELNKGTYSDSLGFFELNRLPAETVRLRISMTGYKNSEISVDLSKQNHEDLKITLIPLLEELDQVVVTGTLTETTIRESPVKVQSVSKNVLNRSGSQNIMDAVKYINGLYTQVDCSVCGTSNIRINGMEGPYTSVLIDGMPVMGALATVYSLEGIQPDVISSLEIIKGPNSTLYGSQAMGGVVNIITVDPETEPTARFSYTGSTHNEQNLTGKLSLDLGDRVSVLSSGSYFRTGSFIDENNDGFSDITQDQRITVFNKWSVQRPDFQKAELAIKYFNEERLGGTRNFDHSLRGNSSIYGESIYTDRLDVIGSYDLPVEADIRLDASWSWHRQDSFYGDYRYEATQITQFANLIYEFNDGTKQGELLAGATFRNDNLDQLFDGQNLPGGSRDDRFIPGLFLQYDKGWNDSFRSLLGFRADHYTDHGVIYSPRISFKFRPDDHNTFRVNAGTGFRIVNLFTEEHEALTGSRRVVITENLDPEQSMNLTFNWNRIIDIGPSVLNADLDVFYTRFSNQIIPDYSNPLLIQYANLNGFSVSQGISLNVAHNFVFPLTYMIGFTVQDVFQEDDEQRMSIPFAPDYTGVFNLSYTIGAADLTVDYTARLSGPMSLPEYPGFADRSPVYTEQNIRFTRSFGSGLQLNLSVNNLFDYVQANPIIAPDQPFSDQFATDYVYGPIQGRRFMFGIAYSL